MKKAKSTLLRRFLDHIDCEYIQAKPNTSGEPVLAHMRSACEAILNGEDTDTALHIERKPGNDIDPKTLEIAYITHVRRKKGDTFDAIHAMFEEYCADKSFNAPSRTRIQQIYKEHGDTADRILKWNEFVAFVEENGERRADGSIKFPRAITNADQGSRTKD